MINRSPWLWGTRKSAAGMTGRTSNGIQILQGKRAKGQSNPSALFLGSQVGAKLIWGLWHEAPGFINENIFSIPSGQYAANVFYKQNYDNALDFTDPLLPVLIPANVIYANGNITPTSPLTAVADDSADTVIITWSTVIADESQSPTDGIFYLIRNRNNGHVISGSAAVRSVGTSGSIVAAPLAMVAGDNLDIYLSANNNGLFDIPNDGSESRYITTVVVA